MFSSPTILPFHLNLCLQFYVSQQFAVGPFCHFPRSPRGAGGRDRATTVCFSFVGLAMEDLVSFEGLFQNEEDFAVVCLIWNFLLPHERLHLLLTSWYLRTGFEHLLLWGAVHNGISA